VLVQLKIKPDWQVLLQILWVESKNKWGGHERQLLSSPPSHVWQVWWHPYCFQSRKKWGLKGELVSFTSFPFSFLKIEMNFEGYYFHQCNILHQLQSRRKIHCEPILLRKDTPLFQMNQKSRFHCCNQGKFLFRFFVQPTGKFKEKRKKKKKKTRAIGIE